MVPFTPSSMRRAGAAHLMSKRLGEDPGVLVKHPLTSQLLAMGAGGYLASQSRDAGRSTQIAAALAPLALVQIMKRKAMTDIGDRYKARRRKTRLRDVAGLDSAIDDQTGSTRLGMVRALGMMKQRKQNLSAVSEAADGLPLAGGLIGGGLGGMALTMPITELIDQIESNRLRKSAGLDQASGPVLPLFLLAALATGGGQMAASLHANSVLNKQKPTARREWDGLVDGPATVSVPELRNAFFARPETSKHVDTFTDFALGDPANAPPPTSIKLPPKWSFLQRAIAPDEDPGWREKLRSRIASHGIVAADPAIASRSVLAHEGGHASIDSKPGLLRFIQRHVYPRKNIVAPLAGVGSMAAGLASGSMLGGALAGTGIGLATSAATLAPEYMASWKALQSLKSKGLESPGDRKALLSALATYAAASVLPSAFAGAAGGWLAGRRKNNPEPETDEVGETVNTEKEAAVSREAAALILQRLAMYKNMNRIARDLGRNAGIRFGETNRIAHAGNPASWNPMRRDKGLIELTGGAMPRSIDKASELVQRYLGTL